MVATDHFAVVEHPNRWSNEPKVRGIVTEQYNLFTYEQAIDVLNETLPLDIATAGLFSNGTMFACYELPKFDIKGDEHRRYITVGIPVDGKSAATASESDVRVRCWNTFQLSLHEASVAYRIFHDRNVEENFRFFTLNLYQKFVETAAVVQEALNILANHKIRPGEGQKILDDAYPLPAMPKDDLRKEVYDKRVDAWEVARDRTVDLRNFARDLYMGKGTGLDTAATRGTAYGVFQAVVESENFRRGKEGNFSLGESTKATAESVLLGSRKDTIDRAFRAAMEVSKN